MQALHQAAALHQSGELEEARRLYKAVLRGAPDNFDALHFLGVLEAQRGRHDKADGLIRKALRVNPHSAEAWSNLGNIQRDGGRPKDALTSYAKALQLKPDYANALNNQGIALLALKEFQRAVASFEKALEAEPRFGSAHYNRGIALLRMRRFEEALASFDQALVFNPTLADAHVDRGNALMELGCLDQALAAFDRALALAPGLANALYNRSVALLRLGRFEDALGGFNRTLEIEPRHLGALNNKGTVFLELGRLEDALETFDKAIAIRKDNPEALNNRGAALEGLNRCDDALASYEKAAAIAPSQPDAPYKRGLLLEKLKRFDDAIAAYQAVLKLDPAYKYALGRLVHTKMHACRWDDLPGEITRLSIAIRHGTCVSDPFTVLSASAEPADQLACARTFAVDKYPPAKAPLRHGARERRDRIRLAYVCGEFREHATSYLAAELFELHDKARFETFAIATGADDHSAMRRRIEAAFDVFIDGSAKPDAELAELLCRSEIEIAVNLNGYFGIERTGVFALRPSPIQVNYLGFPGTMGADYMDYIIADRRVIPGDSHSFYSEKVVYLPDSYQVNDSKKSINESTPTRAAVGLPESGFVFCCFNNNHKITPDMFGIWMQLLQQVDGSVLWLLEGNPEAKGNLRREAEARGIAAERIVFAPRLTLSDHLARHRLADLFLDTLPHNAHTTASDALWAGLPVLTCVGPTFASRVAASLLDAVGLSELITHAIDEYETQALQLARNPPLLAALKDKLARNRGTSPLYDTNRYRRHIEAAYTVMWERYQRGEGPASFSVEPFGRDVPVVAV